VHISSASFQVEKGFGAFDGEKSLGSVFCFGVMDLRGATMRLILDHSHEDHGLRPGKAWGQFVCSVEQVRHCSHFLRPERFQCSFGTSGCISHSQFCYFAVQFMAILQWMAIFGLCSMGLSLFFVSNIVDHIGTS
jgi:hypothetical protein